MYPSHLGPGDRVDFVEPPAGGPILGYSHQTVATLYAYAGNNPIRFIDPSGMRIAACCVGVVSGPQMAGHGVISSYVHVPATGPANPCPAGSFECGPSIDQKDIKTISAMCKAAAAACPKCSVADYERGIAQILGVANKTFYDFGTDRCQGWVFTLEKNVADLTNAGKRLSPGGCYTLVEARTYVKGAGAPWWQIGFKQHVVYRIELCDGSLINLDRGLFGGDDHISFPGDVPSYYSPGHIDDTTGEVIPRPE